jgi:hypothetical protein
LRAVADFEMGKMSTLGKTRVRTGTGAPLFAVNSAAAQKSCGNDSILRPRGDTRTADTPAAALGGAAARRGRENVFDLIEPTWSVVIHRAAHYARHDADESARLASAIG